MNKKIPLIALGMLSVGAVGSIALQSLAQTPSTNPPVGVVSTQTDQGVEQKDAPGTDTETNDGGTDVVSASILSQVKISEAQARQIVLSANPITTITTIAVGDENGKAIYEVAMSNNTEVKIDAVTGSVLKTDTEGAGGEGDTTEQKDAPGTDTETNDGPGGNN